MQKKTEYLHITHNENVYPIRIRRNPVARRMILRFSKATGEASLTLPASVPLEHGKSFIQKQIGWLEKRQNEIPDRTAFEEGAIILLRGEKLRIVRRDGRGVTHIVQETTPALVIHCSPQHLSRRVTDYLKQEAIHDLHLAVAHFSTQINKKVKRISLRDTHSRWGSCSSSGSLNFSWRLILAPPFVLEYLAAHEVAHLQEMNHSPRFWALARFLFPETDKAEQWLKKFGSSLHLYG